MKTNLEELREFFLDVIEDLCHKYSFDKFLYSPTRENYYNWFGSLEDMPRDISFACGLSKAVIIVDNSYGYDWVVKIPFSNERVDYCKIEEDIYKEAVAWNIQDIFAESFFLDRYRGVKLYLMARADVDEDELTSHSSDFSSSHTSDDFGTYINPVVIDCLSCFYSNEFMNLLYEFCESNDVFDIHESNVGFFNGIPYIIDYSGYTR